MENYNNEITLDYLDISCQDSETKLPTFTFKFYGECKDFYVKENFLFDRKGYFIEAFYQDGQFCFHAIPDTLSFRIKRFICYGLKDIAKRIIAGKKVLWGIKYHLTELFSLTKNCKGIDLD